MKKKSVVTHETKIQAGAAEYEAAVNTFAIAKQKLDASNEVLYAVDTDIDAEIAALQAKKAAIAEQKQRNANFGAKLSEFLN